LDIINFQAIKIWNYSTDIINFYDIKL